MKSLSFATLSFATLGVLASVGAAMAADLPVKAPRAPVASPVAYDWTGFYVGGNVGVAWLDKSVTEVSTSGGSLANPPPFSQR